MRGLTGLLLLLAACGESRPAPFLRVGSRDFSRGDLEVRARIISIQQGAEDPALVGSCAQLVRGTLLAAVLERLDAAVGASDLDRESARIDRETRDAGRLGEIKAACGGSGAYRELFLKPQLANRRYYFEVYPKLPEPKKTADEHFWDLAGAVPVEIRDAALRESFVRSVSWASRVRLAP